MRKRMKISADFAGRILEAVHLLDSFVRGRAHRFFSILQSECKECQTLAKIVMKFRRQATAFFFLCSDQHATKPHLLVFRSLQPEIHGENAETENGERRGYPYPFGTFPERWGTEQHRAPSRKVLFSESPANLRPANRTCR